MLRKANRRIAVGAALALVAASLVVLVPPADAAGLTQVSPFGGSTTTGNSSAFGDTMNTTGAAGMVHYNNPVSTPAGLNVSQTTGGITTTGKLAVGTYTVTGDTSDTGGSNTGIYSYILVVAQTPILQTAPLGNTTTTALSPGFTDQLTTNGSGVAFHETLPNPSLVVDLSGHVSTTGALAAGNHVANGTLSDSFGDGGSFTYSLSVAGGAITQVAPTSAAVGTAGSAAFTDQLNTTGGVGAVTFLKTGGGLGVNVSPSGGITTTGVLAPGTYSAIGSTTDSLGNTGTFSFTLTVSTVPGAPTAVSASGGNNSATVRWSAPLNNGGSPITGYVITPYAVAPSPPSTGTPDVVAPGTSATVGGLTNGTHYAFTVAAMNVNGTGPPSALSAPVVPDSSGYWLVASDGGIFSFGSQQFFGSTGGKVLNQPIVGMASTPSGRGYWLVASDGGIFAFGDAGFFGSTGAKRLNKPIVGMAATPDGGGYWLVASDGGIFAFGDAKFHGSTGNKVLNRPVVGMAATSGGNGYWLVASDGGIFGFGTAATSFYGSTGNIHLNKPIVGMATTADGKGYWLVASDGGIFSFGDAVFYGSAGAVHLNKPIVGMGLSPHGRGYWLVASDGGIFSYGDAVFYGSTGAMALNQPIVGLG